MLLYINGDSHSNGAEINNPYTFADDQDDVHDNRAGHPNNIPDSYGAVLAKNLKWDYYCDAESGSSNQRIIRTTRNFFDKIDITNIFVLIGWSGWDRTEILYNNRYEQLSPGKTTDDKELKQIQKNYILNLDITEEMRSQHYEIYNFHCELKQKQIPHLFFNAFMFFDHNIEKHNWGSFYVSPYEKNLFFTEWARLQGYSTVNKNSYHYGKDAHRAWAKFLQNHINKNQSELFFQ